MTKFQNIASFGCGCDAPELVSGLIRYEEAKQHIAQSARAHKAAEVLPLSQVRGRVLAEPCITRTALPAFANSAMDGYAICSEALQGQGPWTLQVVDRVKAGSLPLVPVSGHGVSQIFTGAPIPEGADAVVMQEKVKRVGDQIEIFDRPRVGENIRKAGEEAAANATVLEAGTVLGVREIAACAAVGATSLKVAPKLRVALVVTGDELAATSDRPPSPENATIYDVNTPMLLAELSRPDVDLTLVHRSADDRQSLQEQLARVAQNNDLIVTTGGLSVGEEDHVRPALHGLGATIIFNGVAIKPGKPVALGRLGACHWLGLPGNPMAAYVTWALFGAALVDRLSGAMARHPLQRQVVLGNAIKHKPGRAEFRPVQLSGSDELGRETVCADSATHSNRITGLPHRDGVMLIPAHAEHLSKGTMVSFFPFPTV